MSRHIEPMTTMPEKVLARVEGRMVAKDLWELVEDRSDDRGFMGSLIEELQRRAGLLPPLPEEEKHEPIARLGKLQMVFGAHKGKPFDEIPLDYLNWLCGQQEDFYKSLRAYLKHPHLQSHRGEYDDAGE